MANTKRKGFNSRIGEKENYEITAITLEDGTKYYSDNHLIDIRHEGAYITNVHTKHGMLIPSRFILRVDYKIQPKKDEPSLYNL